LQLGGVPVFRGLGAGCEVLLADGVLCQWFRVLRLEFCVLVPLELLSLIHHRFFLLRLPRVFLHGLLHIRSGISDQEL
jgi:hypothetical protein